jgi:hypothetical protein
VLAKSGALPAELHAHSGTNIDFKAFATVSKQQTPNYHFSPAVKTSDNSLARRLILSSDSLSSATSFANTS